MCKHKVKIATGWRKKFGVVRREYSYRQCKNKPAVDGYCKKHATQQNQKRGVMWKNYEDLPTGV